MIQPNIFLIQKLLTAKLSRQRHSDIRLPLPDQCGMSLSGPSNAPTLRFFKALRFQQWSLLLFMDFSQLASFRTRVLALRVQFSSTMM